MELVEFSRIGEEQEAENRERKEEKIQRKGMETMNVYFLLFLIQVDPTFITNPNHLYQMVNNTN